MRGQLARHKLQSAFDRFDTLAVEAQRRSVTDGEPYVLVWQKDGAIRLYPVAWNAEQRRTRDAAAAWAARRLGRTIYPGARRFAHAPARRRMDVLAQRQLRARQESNTRASAGAWEAVYNPLSARRHASHPFSRDESPTPFVPPPPPPFRAAGGFLLLEIVLATIIFVVGVVALGRAMGNCLTAQEFRVQEETARTALENRMAEIQASPVLPDENRETVLKGMFTGITLIEHRHTLEVKNEDNVALPDLHEMTMTAEWAGPHGRKQVRTVAFTLLRGQG